MKTILRAVFFCFLFASCSHKSKDNNKKVDYLLHHNTISKLVKKNHQKIKNIHGNYASYKRYLNNLDNDSLTSIPYALDYITTCISPNNSDCDSIFLLFNIKFYTIANRLSDSLYTKYKFLIVQFDKDSNTNERRSFKQNIEACGIDIFSSEGTYYLDVIPDYFYTHFKNRVSEGVAAFLSIRKVEMEEGFSEDAGMLISFEKLYERVKHWESFIKKYPNTVYHDEANSYYVSYLETLLTGMDNSRIFDFDKNVLLPEIKTLYQNILNDSPESPTTQIVSSYYTFLARHNFTENDSIEVFLKAHNLSTMLAVQPSIR